ncbi:MAG: MBL fold metallo-hydrolase [Frankiaceae bacterium]|jgi:L-ascorbate metabolism protein UlaG (beta-lactamase superfamily)|nr:MBL fold metallo-hydrolase [Frankiaceae bacterium]
MRLTKLEHSCVRIDADGGTVVIDPGSFGDPPAALAGAGAVLITHEHPDHLDVPALLDALRADPALRAWAPARVAAQLAERGDQVSAVGPGEAFEVAGLPVRTVGGQHAMIHISMPVVANIGYLIGNSGESLYHPGDALLVPPEPVDTALIPIGAPWSNVGQVIDFAVGLRARRAHQIHEGVLSAAGLAIAEGHVGRIAGEHGTEFEHLDVGRSIER